MKQYGVEKNWPSAIVRLPNVGRKEKRTRLELLQYGYWRVMDWIIGVSNEDVLEIVNEGTRYSHSKQERLTGLGA